MFRILILCLTIGCSPAPEPQYPVSSDTSITSTTTYEDSGRESYRERMARADQRQLDLSRAIYSRPAEPSSISEPGLLAPTGRAPLEIPRARTLDKPVPIVGRPHPITRTHVLPRRKRLPRSWTRDGARRASGTILAGALIGVGWAAIARMYLAGTGDVLSGAALEQLADAIIAVGDPPSTTLSTIAHDIAIGEIGQIMRVDQAAGGYSASNIELYQYYADENLFAHLRPGEFESPANNAIWTPETRARTIERYLTYQEIVPQSSTISQALANTLHRAHIVDMYAHVAQGDELLVQTYQALTVHHRGMIVREIKRACAQLGIDYAEHLTPMAAQMLARPNYNPIAVLDFVLDALIPHLTGSELAAAKHAKSELDVILYTRDGGVCAVISATYGSCAPPI